MNDKQFYGRHKFIGNPSQRYKLLKVKNIKLHLANNPVMDIQIY